MDLMLYLWACALGGLSRSEQVPVIGMDIYLTEWT